VTQSPVEIAEPLEGITDAIQAAEDWLLAARTHRDRPDEGGWRAVTLTARWTVIDKLQALK
jgi:hypothetical protein